MKLSSLTLQDKLRLAAELDGKLHPTKGLLDTGNSKHPFMWWNKDWEFLPNYSASYDAIIPLIQKQPEIVCDRIKRLLSQLRFWFKATPSQLLDALLVATGKAE